MLLQKTIITLKSIKNCNYRLSTLSVVKIGKAMNDYVTVTGKHSKPFLSQMQVIKKITSGLSNEQRSSLFDSLA